TSMFHHLSHWEAEQRLLRPEQLLSEKNKSFSLFSYVYQLTQKHCQETPLRKNGEISFIHPMNVVLNLIRAGVTDEVTFCVGFLHDVVEDRVDTYKDTNLIGENEAGRKKLELYRQEAFDELKKELLVWCNSQQCEEIIEAVRLVTRRRSETYYTYIAGMFSCTNKRAKEIALQAKLADRIHNVLCIAHFTEENRIHECFKNIFMLNNVKKYLLDTQGKAFLSKKNPLERLFTQCCKATYDAFFTICALTEKKGIQPIVPMLQLALMKFAFEMKGLWEVTKLNRNEPHPLRLYQSVVRKYDLRLRHEKEKFNAMKHDELTYCKKFFAEYHFTDEQLQAIIDYKDAYGLKEAVGRLLYKPEYVLSGFLTTELAVEK
ncbi:hypothetical protein HYX13_02550, partial [Candidatus Woesearchaeota archaeon]|nr:hypothetical protein [Candidatus Woesearchaeota archaeon]